VLAGRPFVGFLLIADAERAKAFYCDVLGLPLVHEDDFAVVVDAGGTSLRLAVVDAVPEPAGTNAGFLVADVGAAARELAAAGVTFERFEGMQQDDDGVWRPPGGGGVAWFRDPDGNRISLAHNA
jgi:catechol 2,3-dioxygenase-like lactoylglutathione lyase family enzyme